MVMKLYGAGTPNVERSILPFFEAEVDEKELQLVRVNMMAGQHKEPIYTSKQPFGQVPYFEDGDITIFESRAIARYIAEKYEGQGTSLVGKTLKERATINQWLEVEVQEFHPPIAAVGKELFMARAFKKPANEELIATNAANFGKVLDVYEAHLSKGNKYLVGDRYTLADAFHVPYLEKVKTLRPDVLVGRPHVSAWADDLTSRPAYQKVKQLNWDSAPVLQ